MQTIATGNLTLEPQMAAHAAEMFGLLSDPAIYEHENAPPRSLEWLRARFATVGADRRSAIATSSPAPTGGAASRARRSRA